MCEEESGKSALLLRRTLSQTLERAFKQHRPLDLEVCVPESVRRLYPKANFVAESINQMYNFIGKNVMADYADFSRRIELTRKLNNLDDMRFEDRVTTLSTGSKFSFSAVKPDLLLREQKIALNHKEIQRLKNEIDQEKASASVIRQQLVQKREKVLQIVSALRNQKSVYAKAMQVRDQFKAPTASA
eukprot:TRINITY_DN5379_c0_g1_i1.p1 TRINITY_DN5379_c0_g1~~TRINITY_DN5379_c0_g1_i1.p1  ORF type:complete len:187 (-),score=31.06 TRINITY_DN5379_c0_g1_i1:654-1214(-)